MEEDRSVETLVDFVVISGLDENQDLTNEIYADSAADPDSIRPLDQSYQPHVLEQFPAERPWESKFDPNAVALMCFPRGLRFKLESDHRRVRLHPFTITKESGSRTYGVSLEVYERVTNARTVEALNVLEQMHKHSQESLLSTFATASSGSRRSSAAPRSPEKSTRWTAIDTLYAPKSIALLSQFPVVATLEQFLRQLYAAEKTGLAPHSTGNLLKHLLTSVPVPVDGWSVTFSCIDQIKVYRPTLQDLPLCQFSFRRLFGLFTVETVVKLFTCVLLEQQIVLVSSDYELPILVSECLVALLYPFLWQNVYVPILPSNALHFLEAPVPYIMGIHSSMRHLEFGNVDCIIDIDEGTKTLPDDLPEYPYADTLVRSLKALLKSPEMQPTTAAQNCEPWRVPPMNVPELPPFPNNIDSEAERLYNQKVRELFIATFAEMFADVDSYIITPEENYVQNDETDGPELFDYLSFVSDQPKEHLDFLLHFTQSQIFAGFMDAQGFGHGQMHGDMSLAYFKRLVGNSVSTSMNTSGGTPKTSVSYSKDSGADGPGRLQHIISHIFNRRNSDTPAVRQARLRDPDLAYIVPPPQPDRPSKESQDSLALFGALDDLKECDVKVGPYHDKVRGADTKALEALLFSGLALSNPSSPDSDSDEGPAEMSNGADRGSNMARRHTDSSRASAFTRRHTDGSSGTNTSNNDAFVADIANRARLLSDGSSLKSNGTGSDLRYRTNTGSTTSSKQAPSKAMQQAHKLMTIGQKTSASTTHDSYHQTLLEECSSKIKNCVLAALDGDTASSLGYAAAAGVDHIVISLCEVLERIWRHGSKSTRGKSCLWVFLDQSSKLTTLATESGGTSTVAAIEAMQLKSDVGRARAWVRLCLERKTIKQELEGYLSHSELLPRFFKDYAFLMQEEYRTQLLFQLLSLTTVELASFSPKYPEMEFDYTVTIYTRKGFRGSGSVIFSCTGSLLKSEPINCPQGSHFASGQECTLNFKNQNLGTLSKAVLEYGSASWSVECVAIRNCFTGAEILFEPEDETVGGSHSRVGCIVLLPQTDKAVPGIICTPTKGKRVSGQAIEFDESVQHAHDGLCEAVAAMVNCIVRSYMREDHEPSPAKRALLLLGGSRINTQSSVAMNAHGVDSITEGGLCKTLIHIFSYGFKPAVSFLGSDRHPWDLLAKFASNAKRAEAAAEREKPHGRRSGRLSLGAASSMSSADTFGGRSGRESWSQIRDPALASDPVNLLVSTIQRANRAKISKAVRFEFFVCAGASYHVLHVWFKSLADFALTSGLYHETSVFHNEAACENVTEMMRILIDFQFDLLGRLLYVRYDEGSFWELQDDEESPCLSPASE